MTITDSDCGRRVIAEPREAIKRFCTPVERDKDRLVWLMRVAGKHFFNLLSTVKYLTCISTF